MRRVLAVYIVLGLVGVGAAAYAYMQEGGFDARDGGGASVDTGIQATSTGQSLASHDGEPRDAEPSVVIGGVRVRVDIADTPEERVNGLSGREHLAQGEGMLFIFPTDDHHGIWMKDMNFSIDIIWLSAEGRVVDIAPHVSPETYPASFSPRDVARNVLEVPAGFAKSHGIAVGAEATILR